MIRWKKFTAASVVTLSLAALLVFCTGHDGQSAWARVPPLPGKPAATPATMTFCDEFQTISLRGPRGGTWDASYVWQGKANGSSLPNEQEWYIDPRFAPTKGIDTLMAKNGILTITAEKTPANAIPYVEGHPFVSGMLTTFRGFGQRYGYFETRAQLPRGRGLWPAFWLVPKDGTSSHEIDVFEMLGQEPNKLHVTLHLFKPVHVFTTREVAVGDTTTGFHTYGVNWTRQAITWYFDRKPIYQLPNPYDLDKPMFMILNLAAGGPLPGPVGADVRWPARMLVDYVRVFSALPAPGQFEPGKPGSGTCPVRATAR